MTSGSASRPSAMEHIVGQLVDLTAGGTASAAELDVRRREVVAHFSGRAVTEGAAAELAAGLGSIRDRHDLWVREQGVSEGMGRGVTTRLLGGEQVEVPPHKAEKIGAAVTAHLGAFLDSFDLVERARLTSRRHEPPVPQEAAKAAPVQSPVPKSPAAPSPATAPPRAQAAKATKATRAGRGPKAPGDKAPGRRLPDSEGEKFDGKAMAHLRVLETELLNEFDAEAALDAEADRNAEDGNALGLMSAGTESDSERVDPVRTYFNSIGKTKLLTAEQEVELAFAIEAGLLAGEQLDIAEAAGKELPGPLHRDLQRLKREGKSAQDRMLHANLRLVISIAKRYVGHGLDFLDLIQVGNLGLIRAVEKFDYQRGYKFSTYATWWIRQAVTRALADQGRTIRIPVHMVESINKMQRVRRDMAQILGREPTASELAEALDIEPEQVLEMRQHAQAMSSLDQFVGDGESRLGDFIEDTDELDELDGVFSMEMRNAVRAVLATLGQREADVVRLRFGLVDGEERTLDQIGRIYGITRERIRQILAVAMIKLRDRSGHLEAFIGW